MLTQYDTEFTGMQSAELRQYCKLENVLPISLMRAGKPKTAMKLRLKTAAFHLLQRLDKTVSSLINRLTADLEHSGVAPRSLS